MKLMLQDRMGPRRRRGMVLAMASAAPDDAVKLSPKSTFQIGLMSGAVAGSAVDLALFPLDTLKTRLQASAGTKFSISMLSNLYRGVLPTIVSSAPAGATFFGTYDFMKRTITKSFNLSPDQAVFAHLGAAAAGDVTSSAVRVPFELVKQRLQAGTHNSVTAAVKSIVQKNGVRGLFTGYGPLVIRELPFDLIEFPLYEYLKARWTRSRSGKPLATWQTSLCGSFAGGLAAAATTPLDVVKTRIMVSGSRANAPQYAGIVDALKTIAVEEGPGALFSGIVPRVMWISLGGAVFFGGYEVAKTKLTPRFVEKEAAEAAAALRTAK